MISISSSCDKKYYSKIEDFIFDYEQDLNQIRLNELSCPVCGAKGRFRSAGSYLKSAVILIGGKRKDVSLTVHRVYCHSCKKTHALIPSFAIPFGSYSIQFVIFVILKYLKHACRVDALCEKFSISVSTLYLWIHTFVTHFNLTQKVLNKINWVTNEAITQTGNSSFLKEFHECYGFCFMQRVCPTNSRNRFFPP